MTNMTEPISPVALVPYQGKDIKVIVPDYGQLALLQYQANILTKDNVTKEEGKRALGLVYRVVRSSIPEPDDANLVEDALADRSITMGEVIKLIVSAADRVPDEETPAKPVVKRGRPRKTAAK
jgi:hypothetical protein